MKAVTLKLTLTAYDGSMYDAQERIASDLRRIADIIEQGDTLGESGNMFGATDSGQWEINDPWEDEPTTPTTNTDEGVK